MSYGMLASGLIAWFLAGLLKVPVAYMLKRQVDWGLIFSTGGFPSSHSALITGTTLGIGLFSGFDTPAFALAFATSMIVVYDATGVRRQAGIHAQRINMILNEFFSGHPLSEQQLKEVLGHTPFEVVAGALIGIIIAVLTWGFWPR